MHEPELTPEQMRDAANELMMSVTMGKLAQFSETIPVDIHDADELKSALASCSMELIRALDADRIHFDSDVDRAMLHGLLTVTLSVVIGGPFGAQARVQ